MATRSIMNMQFQFRVSPRVFLIALVPCGFAIAAVGTYWQNASRGPAHSCVFEESTFEFGETAVGDVLSHKFCFKNVGPGTMQVRRVLADCGCIVHKLKKTCYRSGEEGHVSISLNTTGLTAPASMQHSIWFEYSHDGKVAGSELNVAVSLAPDVECSPQEVALARDPFSGVMCSRLTISRRMLSHNDFRQLQIEGKASQFTIHEVSRSSEAIVFDICAEHDKAFNGPQSIILRYARAGVARYQRVGVQCPIITDRVTIRPSSYVAIATSDVLRADVAIRSKKKFQLVSLDESEFTITSVETSGDLEKEMLAWQVLEDEPNQFTLWVKSWPQDNDLVHAELTVTYRNATGTTTGQCLLPVYLSGEPAIEESVVNITSNTQLTPLLPIHALNSPIRLENPPFALQHARVE